MGFNVDTLIPFALSLRYYILQKLSDRAYQCMSGHILRLLQFPNSPKFAILPVHSILYRRHSVCFRLLLYETHDGNNNNNACGHERVRYVNLLNKVLLKGGNALSTAAIVQDGYENSAQNLPSCPLLAGTARVKMKSFLLLTFLSLPNFRLYYQNSISWLVALAGYCYNGERSQMRCSSSSVCSSGQTCINGLCCKTTGNEWQSKRSNAGIALQLLTSCLADACAGLAALASCTNGICGEFICTTSNYCCECEFGRSSGLCSKVSAFGLIESLMIQRLIIIISLKKK